MMKKELPLKMFANGQDMEPVWLKRLSFTSVLVSSNLLQTMFSRTQDGLTSKQWLLLTITSSIPDYPTLSDLGKYMGCSRQNVKQIAEILYKNGYIDYTKNDGDRNSVRIITTEKWKEYATKNDAYTSGILEEIFEGFSEEELQQFFSCFCKLMDNIEEVNKRIAEK